MRRITETFRVYEYSRVVEDDEKPSLRAVPASAVYDTTAEEVTGVRPGLRKCGALADGKRRVG